MYQRDRYVRFTIEVERAPPKYKLPNRFEPKVNRFELAKMLSHEAYNLVLKPTLSKLASSLVNWRRYLKSPYLNHAGTLARSLVKEARSVKERVEAFLSSPCIYGVFSPPLGGFWPRKDRCTGCMRCHQEYPKVVPRVVLGEEFRSLSFLGLKPSDIYTIWYEAAEGKELVKGMAYGGQLGGPGWDGIWLDMSEIVRPTRDGKEGREYISTSVDIGRKPFLIEFDKNGDALFLSNVVTYQLPVFFDYLPPELSNLNMVRAIVEASKVSQTFVILDISYLKRLKVKEEYNHNIIPLISKDDVEKEKDLIGKARIVELDDASEHETSLVRFYNPHTIIINRLKANRNLGKTVLDMVKERLVDCIHVCAGYDGKEFEQDNPRHVRDVIRDVHSLLVKEGLRDEVTLIGSGGMFLAEHVVKAIICGLDAVGIDVTVHIAIQSKFRERANLPYGIEIKPRRVDEKWARRRITNLLAAWHEQIIEALSAMGKREVRRMRGDVGRAMFYDEVRNEAFGGIERARKPVVAR